MAKIDNLTTASLNRYYNRLRSCGSVPYDEVYRLIILSYIQEILDNRFITALTDEELQIVEKALNCLIYKSIIIDYRDIPTDDTMYKIQSGQFRISEDSILRVMERGPLRMES